MVVPVPPNVVPITPVVPIKPAAVLVTIPADDRLGMLTVPFMLTAVKLPLSPPPTFRVVPTFSNAVMAVEPLPKSKHIWVKLPQDPTVRKPS